MNKIKLGRIKFVDNTKRKFGSSSGYIAFWVTTEQGIKSPLILTQSEYQIATNRANDNPEDMPKLRKSFVDSVIDWFK